MTDLTEVPLFVPSAMTVWPFTPSADNRAAWQEVIDTPNAHLVTYASGKLATPAESRAYAELFLAGPEADAHAVFKVDADDILTEAEVLELIRDATANRQAAAFARHCGVSKVAISQILMRDRRPGTSVLDAMGLTRIRGTRFYIKQRPGRAGYDSDARGGHGGTKRRIAA